MNTCVLNHQDAVEVNLPAVKNLVRELAQNLLDADPETIWGDISVVLTDDSGIVPANLEFFGKNRPTDVISFRSDPIPGEDGTTGDLIVNVECARREGPRHDGENYELALYIAHGIDHLSGADDNTPEKRAAMRTTETHWLAALQTDIKNLIVS